MAFKRNEVALGGRGRDNSESDLEELERRLQAAEDRTEKIGAMLGRVLQTLADSSEEARACIERHRDSNDREELLGDALKGGEDKGDGVR
ncbi:hypothetical protein PG994_004244 [Apiospora phragmitis]|uniref:Uncharacterized protein n=1 Tax=Apiospora phragmitis TaxID=2905665 RepID=A0ABR1VQ21_9PEZI